MTCYSGVIFVEKQILFKYCWRNFIHICDMSQDENLIQFFYLLDTLCQHPDTHPARKTDQVDNESKNMG